MQIQASGAEIYINGQRIPFASEAHFGVEFPVAHTSANTMSCSLVMSCEMSGALEQILSPHGKVYSGSARDRRRQRRADRKLARAQAAQGAVTFKRWSNGAHRPVSV